MDIDDAKLHARIDPSVGTAEDGLVLSYIGAARVNAEQFTNRQLITAVYELQLDSFPCHCQWIELPLPPLQEVVSVKYLDTSGVEQTWDPANYIVDAPAGEVCKPGRVALAYTIVWPSTYPVMNAVKIRYTCGYGDTPANIPEGIKNGLRMHVADYYEHRNSNISGTISQPAPVTVVGALWPFKVWPRAA